MPRNITQTVSQPEVETVTVTLDADEIRLLVRALENMCYFASAETFRDMLVVKTRPDADVFLKTGVCDRDIRDGRKIQAIKTVRVVTGLGLKQAKDAVDAYAQTL